MLFRKSFLAVCLTVTLAHIGCGAPEEETDDTVAPVPDEASGGAGAAGGEGLGLAGSGGSQVDAGNSGGSPSTGGASGAPGGMTGSGGVGGVDGGNVGGVGGKPLVGQVIRIQPLGDSITQGKKDPDEASYRRPLWKKLIAAGYKVDFVGSTNQQLDGAPFYKDYDHDHEGHYGWKITDVLPKLDGWLAGYTPDVSLIHLGTNDQGSNNPAQMVMNIGTIIDKLRAKNPKVIVIVAKLIEPSPIGRSFGDMLPALAMAKGTPQSPIIVVDQDANFSQVDTRDGIHPNPMGQEKMAIKWFDALATVLPKP